MLAVTPVAIVVVLLGVFLAWSLFSSDISPGSSWIEIGALALAIVGVVAAVATLIAAHRIGRGMSSRIGEVSSAARRVARKDLVDLLDALRSPDHDLESISPMDLDSGAGDEIGDLARSFEELHGALIDVGARQMETMRAGVSSIFVTLARRNSSLVDRQLALLDELESREEDPEVLGGFYRLDHLATRMRRNAESLLVLAGSESPRVWAKATDMSDVVRAAVSEIDEYQRIEVLALEPARLSGSAVSDVSHLVAELLENAIQFSAPTETIRVTGLFDMDGYQLAISDRGVGMTEARIAEMNRILDRPPALGLSVEPTLGMYVVAKLADRHDLDVELIRGMPGITARITIPRDRLETKTEWRPAETDHTEPSLASNTLPLPSLETAIAASREEEPVHAAEAEPDRVIDLTEPSHNEPGIDQPAPSLPVRTPGLAFSADTDPVPSVSPGEGASRIQAALAAYEVGRSHAVAGEQAEPASPREDTHPEDDPR